MPRAELVPDGAELELWHGFKEVPPFDEDDEPAPARIVEKLRAAIAGADAVLIATPEYNGSLPGQLKNALDWASRPHATSPFRNKPVAVVGASPGGFGARVGAGRRAPDPRAHGSAGARRRARSLARAVAVRCRRAARGRDRRPTARLGRGRARRRGCRPGAPRRLVFGRCPTRRPLLLPTVQPTSR